MDQKKLDTIGWVMIGVGALGGMVLGALAGILLGSDILGASLGVFVAFLGFGYLCDSTILFLEN